MTAALAPVAILDCFHLPMLFVSHLSCFRSFRLLFYTYQMRFYSTEQSIFGSRAATSPCPVLELAPESSCCCWASHNLQRPIAPLQHGHDDSWLSQSTPYPHPNDEIKKWSQSSRLYWTNRNSFSMTDEFLSFYTCRGRRFHAVLVSRCRSCRDVLDV